MKFIAAFVFAFAIANQASAENCVLSTSTVKDPSHFTWVAVGGNNTFFQSNVTWYRVVLGPTPKPAVYFNLGVQYVLATLNIVNGAIMPVEVAAAYNEATALFTIFAPTYNFKSDPVVTQDFLDAQAVLKKFNSGRFGVDRCS